MTTPDLPGVRSWPSTGPGRYLLHALLAALALLAVTAGVAVSAAGAAPLDSPAPVAVATGASAEQTAVLPHRVRTVAQAGPFLGTGAGTVPDLLVGMALLALLVVVVRRLLAPRCRPRHALPLWRGPPRLALRFLP